MSDLLEEAYELLREGGFLVKKIGYPPYPRRSVDMVARTDDRTLVIKVAKEKPLKEEIDDLKKLSMATASSPLILGHEAEEDIVIERNDVYELSMVGLMKLIAREKLFLVRKRGGIFVKVKASELKRQREIYGMSRGQLAEALGVTSKAVYDYEMESSLVSIEVAEKMIDLFGEVILGDVSSEICKFSPLSDSENYENTTVSSLKELGIRAIPLSRTPADAIVSLPHQNIIVTEETRNTKESTLKLNESSKLSSALNNQMIFVAKSRKMAEEAGNKGIEVIMQDELPRLAGSLNEHNKDSRRQC